MYAKWFYKPLKMKSKIFSKIRANLRKLWFWPLWEDNLLPNLHPIRWEDHRYLTWKWWWCYQECLYLSILCIPLKRRRKKVDSLHRGSELSSELRNLWVMTSQHWIMTYDWRVIFFLNIELFYEKIFINLLINQIFVSTANESDNMKSQFKNVNSFTHKIS